MIFSSGITTMLTQPWSLPLAVSILHTLRPPSVDLAFRRHRAETTTPSRTILSRLSAKLVATFTPNTLLDGIVSFKTRVSTLNDIFNRSRTSYDTGVVTGLTCQWLD
jgi:hypothetical protein